MGDQPPRDDLFRARYPGYEVRADDDGPAKLSGHFAVFNEWAEIDSSWEGNFLERIAPGAFKKTIAENRGKVRVLFNHGNSHLTDSVLGKITDLREDDDGVRYEVELFDGIPDLLLNGLKAGEYGSSFRFNVVKEEMDFEAERSEHNPDGLPERTLTEVRLREFGPVTFPAYEGATAGVRSMTDRFRPAREEPQHSTQQEPEPPEDPEAATRRDEEPPHSTEATENDETREEEWWLLRP